MTNCPNCGAVVIGNACEYCGTTLTDILRMAWGRPVKMSFEAGDKIYEVNFLPDSMSMTYDRDYTSLYSDGKVVSTITRSCSARMVIEGTCLLFDSDILCIERESGHGNA